MQDRPWPRNRLTKQLNNLTRRPVPRRCVFEHSKWGFRWGLFFALSSSFLEFSERLSERSRPSVFELKVACYPSTICVMRFLPGISGRLGRALRAFESLLRPVRRLRWIVAAVLPQSWGRSSSGTVPRAATALRCRVQRISREESTNAYGVRRFGTWRRNRLVRRRPRQDLQATRRPEATPRTLAPPPAWS